VLAAFFQWVRMLEAICAYARKNSNEAHSAADLADCGAAYGV